jgi:hypothetical protein
MAGNNGNGAVDTKFWRMPKQHCICIKYGQAMRAIAVITDPSKCKRSLEVKKIPRVSKKNHVPPFDKIATQAS